MLLLTRWDLLEEAKGLSGIPNTTNFSNVYFVMVLCVVIMTTFLRSRHGRAVISIRENEIAAEACGVRTTYYKMAAFVLSAFFARNSRRLYASPCMSAKSCKIRFH